MLSLQHIDRHYAPPCEEQSGAMRQCLASTNAIRKCLLCNKGVITCDISRRITLSPHCCFRPPQYCATHVQPISAADVPVRVRLGRELPDAPLNLPPTPPTQLWHQSPYLSHPPVNFKFPDDLPSEINEHPSLYFRQGN